MKIPIRKRFGQRVRELRKASGLSQEAFADKCGFARSYMSRVERGVANPSLDAVQIFADGLGVKVFELFVESRRAVCSGTEVLVPFAKDGSFFNRSIFRPETKEYNVGGKGKGNVKRFKKFEDALAYLESMPVAKWWRPNANASWSLVTAVRWGPLLFEES